ncbi:relaxase/mobilization nuclease domain-containing protein [Larkinella insperata]|uniref:Relaxase/mobilization nuclease domain-containing protein n=1 Tax=Larkinella insperata TaxID=332158 RepID=A0ABW3QBZ4_9BACT
MIGKTVIGTSFGGCVRYQFEGHKHSPDEKRAEVLEAVGVRGYSADAMIADFNRGRMLNPELGRAVWHTSISFNPDDAAKLNNEKILAVAQDYLAGMGLDQTQYAVIRHHDKQHPHFHIIANRVGNDGQTISDSHNYKRSEHLLKQLSQQHGLTPVGEKRVERIQAEQLTGADQTKYQIYQATKQALQGCTSSDDFTARLQQQGITYQIRQNAAGQGVGISFKKDGYSFKGSQVDRKLSLKGIVAQIQQNRYLAAQQTPTVSATSAPVPVLSEVERNWQSAYGQHVQWVQTQNAQIRTDNAWLAQAAEQLRQVPTVETARHLLKSCPHYGLQMVLEEQIKHREYYERNQQWVQEQRQAREAQQKLAFLNDPKGSGLDRLMNDKYYTFWLNAKHSQDSPPALGFEAKTYQKAEYVQASLKDFAERREAAERQRQAQELDRQQQRKNRGLGLGR